MLPATDGAEAAAAANKVAATENCPLPHIGEENQRGSGVAGQDTPAEKNKRAGNGRDIGVVLDAMAAGVPAGTHCGFCRAVLGDAETEQIGHRWYHADACAVEVHKRLAMPVPQSAPPAKPKRRRGRIKGADTTPDVDGLPS